MTHFVKFSDELIALQREISNGKHPKLAATLAANHHLDLETRIGLIAAHCGIPVDGLFTEAGVNALYVRLTDELINRRENPLGIIVVSDTSKFIH